MNDEDCVDVDVGGQPAGQPAHTNPQGQDEKRDHGWDQGGAIEDNPWRDHFGSVCCGRPEVEERREDDQEDVGPEDRQERGVGGEGEVVSCFYSFGEPLKTWTYAMLTCIVYHVILLYS